MFLPLKQTLPFLYCCYLTFASFHNRRHFSVKIISCRYSITVVPPTDTSMLTLWFKRKYCGSQIHHCDPGHTLQFNSRSSNYRPASFTSSLLTHWPHIHSVILLLVLGHVFTGDGDRTLLPTPNDPLSHCLHWPDIQTAQDGISSCTQHPHSEADEQQSGGGERAPHFCGLVYTYNQAEGHSPPQTWGQNSSVSVFGWT